MGYIRHVQSVLSIHRQLAAARLSRVYIRICTGVYVFVLELYHQCCHDQGKKKSIILYHRDVNGLWIMYRVKFKGRLFNALAKQSPIFSQISEIIIRIYGDIVMKMMVNRFCNAEMNDILLSSSRRYIHGRYRTMGSDTGSIQDSGHIDTEEGDG